MSAPAAGAPEAPKRGRKPASSTPDNVVSLPGQSAPPEGKFAVPGSPGFRYTPGIGVWKDNRKVLPWCPVVTRQSMRLDSIDVPDLGGTLTRVSDRMLSIVVGDELANVASADVADGKVWAKFSRAPGVGDRTMRAVLHNIIDDQANRLPRTSMLPRWVDGRLILPPPDLLPRGYGQIKGSPAQWAELLRVTGESGRMALVAGLALAGLYVRPLAGQSFMTHIVGKSSHGKTTAQRVAAAVLGDPWLIILSWAVTKQGPGSWLRSLELLTGFRNDIGAANYPPRELEAHILSWMEGAERDRSTRTGGHETSPGSWYGNLCSTGNDGIVARIANAAVAARVVEVCPPLTASKAHAERVKKLTRRAYGHGLAALVERGPTPDQFAERIAAALVDLGAAELDGAAGRLAEHIAAGVAGARLLAELAEVPEFVAGVLTAAREVLDEQAASMAERGESPGDQLLAILAEHVAAHPAEWPTRTAYAELVKGYPPREVSGWDLTGDPVTGDVAALPRRLRSIAEAGGIVDPDVAINDLWYRGLILPPPASVKGKQYPLKAGGRSHKVYVISGMEAAAAGLDGDQGDQGDQCDQGAALDQAPALDGDQGAGQTITPAVAAELAARATGAALAEGGLEVAEPCGGGVPGQGCGFAVKYQYGGVPWHPDCWQRAQDALALEALAGRQLDLLAEPASAPAELPAAGSAGEGTQDRAPEPVQAVSAGSADVEPAPAGPAVDQLDGDQGAALDGDQAPALAEFNPREWAPVRHRVTAYVDVMTGRGVTEAGAVFTVKRTGAKAGRVAAAAILAALPDEVQVVYLLGMPELAGPVRAWFTGDVRGWSLDRAYLARADSVSANWTRQRDGRKVSAYRIEPWLGATPSGPEVARDAMSALLAALRVTHRGRGARRVEAGELHLFGTPAQTGRDLWRYWANQRDRDGRLYIERFAPLPADIQDLIRATSGQGRIELFTADDPRAELPGLAVQDLTFGYAGLVGELGAGPARLLTGDQAAELFTADPYARGRAHVRVTVPRDWSHVGMLGVTAAELADGWRYPAEPGETFETWADAAEVHLARERGWSVDYLGGLHLTGKGRPLDTWRDRLVSAREHIDRQHDRGELTAEVAKLARAGLRAIVLHGIGAFYARPLPQTRIGAPAEVPAHGRNVVPLPDGRVEWTELAPATGIVAECAHPEWPAAVWARCRTRLLVGPPAAPGEGALALPRADLVAMRTDALYLTSDPGWSSGKVGRFRLKATAPGPLPTPRTWADLDTLRHTALRGE